MAAGVGVASTRPLARLAALAEAFDATGAVPSPEAISKDETLFIGGAGAAWGRVVAISGVSRYLGGDGRVCAISQGSCGQVVHAVDRKSNVDVAIKIIKSKKPFALQARTEIELLCTLLRARPRDARGRAHYRLLVDLKHLGADREEALATAREGEYAQGRSSPISLVCGCTLTLVQSTACSQASACTSTRSRPAGRSRSGRPVAGFPGRR